MDTDAADYVNMKKALTDRLEGWLERNAARVRDSYGYASIEFTLHQPEGDDDNTLILEAKVEEKFLHDSFAARVLGVCFEEPATRPSPEPSPPKP